MASRGHSGGLSAATADAADVLDAFGFGRILIETVGVGQADTEVMSVADLVLLVLAPGMGDHVQALKAGVLEIADVIVVNKSDLNGADALVLDLEEAQDLRIEGSRRAVICKSSARTGEGLRELGEAIERLLDERAHSPAHGEALVTRGAARVLRIVKERLLERWLAEPRLLEQVKALLRGRKAVPPYATAREVFARLLKEGEATSW
jgi:LAO/AO transport system kinase